VSNRQSYLAINLEPPTYTLLVGSDARLLMRTLIESRGHPVPTIRGESRSIAAVGC
jgi:hypothetical protein